MTNKSAALPPTPRQSLVESTIDLIRRHIEEGVWKVGQRIPREQELADMLQVGRNTVREAVRVLSHANVIEVRQGDGTYVRSDVDPLETMRRVTRSSMREHFELRAMLEAEAARLAAIERTEADLTDLRRLLRKRGERHQHNSHEAYVDADLDFHSWLMRASGNAALAELYRYFSSAARLHAISLSEHADLPDPSLDAHATIVDAIERGDGDAAAAAVRSALAPLIDALRKQA